MLPPGPWVKANDFVLENMERATGKTRDVQLEMLLLDIET
jgi:hypothetical protein